jgi:hypothetical protein
MYKSFKLLSIADDHQLRDPARIRRLYWHDNFGLQVAAACCGLLGLGLLGGAGWALYCFLFLGNYMPPFAFWPIFLSCAVMGLIAGWMSKMFYKELSLSPLGAYVKDQAACEFVLGAITSATYLSDGKRSSARMLLKGRFGGNGIFMADFSPSAWSAAVAERGEESLKPGDDRYDQKGKRARLPIPAWVLFRRDSPGWGALAGIPAAAADKLSQSR